MMKRGRPGVKEISEAKKKCYEYYKDFKTVTFCAEKTGYDRKTVTKYYKGFGDATLEEDEEKFIKMQKINKNRIIYKLESIITRGEEQLKRLQDSLLTEDNDEITQINLEKLINKIHGDLINWNQQKAAIIGSPTLDVKIDDLVESRIRELDDREKEITRRENESGKK